MTRKLLLPAAALLLLSACSDKILSGAGATFPYPLYTRWTADYYAQNGVRVDYQSIGSGGGIKQISEMTVDFGASDGPMSEDEMSRAKGGALLHIPVVLGGVAIAYTIPGVADTLNFDGDLISDIFLGKITKWSDPRIAALNPGVSLPDMEITSVHRADGSGTTYVFTDYLSRVSPEWAAGPGKGKDVHWPTGMGALGNEQVAGQVKATPGSIGYIESVYALQNRVLVGRVKNRDGVFLAPNQRTISAAAAEAVSMMDDNTDFRISIVNAPGAEAYPIASFTWLLAYKEQSDASKGRTLVDFMKWAVTEGQAQAAELNYGPLPESIRPRIVRHIESIRLP